MKLVSKASLAFKKKRAAIKVPFGLNVINSLTALFTTAKKNVKAANRFAGSNSRIARA